VRDHRLLARLGAEVTQERRPLRRSHCRRPRALHRLTPRCDLVVRHRRVAHCLAERREKSALGLSLGAELTQLTLHVADDALAVELDAAVARLAAQFRKLPPRTVGISKRIINEGQDMSLRESQDLEIEAQAELLDSPDLREALESYLEKREPRFTGK